MKYYVSQAQEMIQSFTEVYGIALTETTMATMEAVIDAKRRLEAGKCLPDIEESEDEDTYFKRVLQAQGRLACIKVVCDIKGIRLKQGVEYVNNL